MRFRKQHGEKAEEKAKELGVALLSRTQRARKSKKDSKHAESLEPSGATQIEKIQAAEKQGAVPPTPNTVSSGSESGITLPTPFVIII